MRNSEQDSTFYFSMLALAVLVLVLGFQATKSSATHVGNKISSRSQNSDKSSVKTNSENDKAPFVDANADVKNESPQIVVGPFDIHRKYRSMEGPYVIQKFRVSDLVASSKVEVSPESVTYVENSAAAPSMNNSSAGNSSFRPKGLVDTADSEPELYWFRGIKLQILDENDKPLPTAEFLCHLNIDIDNVTRFMQFPELERSGNARLMTLTQGVTEFKFPAPYAVPVAGDEEWKITFQAANRTTNEHRVVKHLCTLIFTKDSELKKPLKALHWFNPYVAVQMDAKTKTEEHHGPSCMAVSAGENADNSVPDAPFKDLRGRTLTGHWSVPPGKHSYQTPLKETVEPEFSKEDRKVHAVWAHVHPLCTSATLSKCDGESKQKIFDINVKTKLNPGLELTHIDSICSREGIDLPAAQNYELSTIYDNPLNEKTDSMVALGIFCESKTFVHPEWAVQKAEDAGLSTQKTTKLPRQLSRNLALRKQLSDRLLEKTKNAKCNDRYCGIK